MRAKWIVSRLYQRYYAGEQLVFMIHRLTDKILYAKHHPEWEDTRLSLRGGR